MRNLTRRGFLVLGAAASLTACGPELPTTVTPAAEVTPAEMLAAINDVRRQYGSNPLVLSPVLTKMANNQARGDPARLAQFAGPPFHPAVQFVDGRWHGGPERPPRQPLRPVLGRRFR